jgi:hypothetical protein
MMKSLFAALLVVGLALAAWEQSSQPQLRPYIFPDDGFGISLPGPVTPYNDGGDRHIHVYTVRLAGGGVFSLRAVHRLMDCDTTLADLWDKADQNKDPAEPVVRGSLKQVSLDGLQGLEYETGKTGERTLHRFHCGNKIFYIFSAGYKGKRPAALDQIINSFRQVNPAHK